MTPGNAMGTAHASPQDESMADVAARQRAIDEKRHEVASAYIQAGRQAMAENRMQDAWRAFKNATDIDPSNKDAQGELDRAAE